MDGCFTQTGWKGVSAIKRQTSSVRDNRQTVSRLAESDSFIDPSSIQLLRTALLGQSDCSLASAAHPRLASSTMHPTGGRWTSRAFTSMTNTLGMSCYDERLHQRALSLCKEHSEWPRASAHRRGEPRLLNVQRSRDLVVWGNLSLRSMMPCCGAVGAQRRMTSSHLLERVCGRDLWCSMPCQPSSSSDLGTSNIDIVRTG